MEKVGKSLAGNIAQGIKMTLKKEVEGQISNVDRMIRTKLKQGARNVRASIAARPPALEKVPGKSQGRTVTTASNTPQMFRTTVIKGKGRKKRRRRAMTFNKLKKKVNRINRFMPKNSVFIQRNVFTNTLTCAYNVKEMGTLFNLTRANVAAAMSAVPMTKINTTTNVATTEAIDISESLNISNFVRFGVTDFIRCKNNSTASLDLWFYVFRPKTRTSTAVEVLIENGYKYLTGALPSAGAGAHAAVMYWPRDVASEWNKDYRLSKYAHVELNAGEEYRTVIRSRGVWNESFMVKYAEAYQAALGAYSVVCIIQGAIIHDTLIQTNVGYAVGQLDCVSQRETKIFYPSAGPKSKFLQTSVSLGEITSGEFGGQDVQMETSGT